MHMLLSSLEVMWTARSGKWSASAGKCQVSKGLHGLTQARIFSRLRNELCKL